jgi:outer membrane protein TolC
MNIQHRKFITLGMLLALLLSSALQAQHDPWSFILPEQRRIEVRQPSELSKAPIPYVPRPPTVADPQFDAPPHYLSLTDAINLGLENLEVVRILSGVTAFSSGRTVYDVAITNTSIDQARANFDPSVNLNNSWNHFEQPQLNPLNAVVGGGQSDNHNFDYGLSKRTLTGGVIDFGVNSARNNLLPSARLANPQTNSSLDLSYTQPLLQGGGATANRIPIVLARINTERSFFQYKDSVQNHVQSVIEGYWALVSARTDLWVREQQAAQSEFANLRTQTQREIGISNLGEAAQTQVAVENFRANLIAAKANVLQREAAFRNVLGLPPYEPSRIVPVSPLIDEKIEIDWEGILSLAETQRPDIIELKLVLEADQQRLLVSKNQASPRLDGVALYRWNGIEGELPLGGAVSSSAGQFTDWTLGVNFSVPLGLRRDRALLRQQELVIRRDQANLQQGLHQAIHILAANLRNLDQYYAQYRRFQAVREAAKLNLDQQMESYNEGLIQFIVVLQAIVDWGNSVSSEAQFLVLYNTELARLERETGSILEAQGIAFFEERYGSLGPRGRFANNECYPYATRPKNSPIDRFGTGDKPSEEFFDLSDPLVNKEDTDGAIEDVKSSDSDPSERPLDDEDPDDAEPEKKSLGRKLLDGPVRAAEALRGIFR